MDDPLLSSTTDWSPISRDEAPVGDPGGSPPQGPQALRDALDELVTQMLPDGARLPSERELATTYGVNRLTVRRAIDHLVAEGHVIRRHGAGSYVHRGTRQQGILAASLSAEARAAGLHAGNAQVSLSYVTADSRMSSLLEIPPGTELTTIMRLRTIERMPIGIAHTWIRRDLVPDLTSLGRDESLLSILLERYGLPIDHVNETITAAVLDRRASQMLRALAMMPALQMTRIMRARDGAALVYSETLLRGDRYKYHNTITRKGK